MLLAKDGRKKREARLRERLIGWRSAVNPSTNALKFLLNIFIYNLQAGVTLCKSDSVHLRGNLTEKKNYIVEQTN